MALKKYQERRQMRNRPNYELKAKVLNNGMVEAQRKLSLTYFKQYQEEVALYENGEIIEQWKPLNENEIQVYKMMAKAFPEEWKEAYRVNDASYHRTKRLKTKIKAMITSGSCIFLTLTFTDKVLDSTSQETRKRYIKRALKTMSDTYIANIDYGKKNEREHYHAIVLASKVSQDQWKYGNLDYERVRVEQEDSPVKIAKYITKLTNHAIKETVKQNRLIYSRL